MCSTPRFTVLVVLLFCSVLATNSQAQFPTFETLEKPHWEHSCMAQFVDTASGVHPVNAFILAKMTEMMYAERLDYQLRYLQNDCCVLDTLSSTDWLCAHTGIDDKNFEQMYQTRFEHYFEHQQGGEEATGLQQQQDEVVFRFLNKHHTEDARFMGVKYKSGLDPELMLVSTPTTIFILFRGTDDVGENEWAEWLGTDFRINQRAAGGALVGTRIHTGFWLSFDLIRDELLSNLIELGAKDKNIWIAGHSLGAALSVITGTYLKASGFDVQNVYAYACPRTIGNRNFIKKANALLPNRIQRFEYYRDPVTLLWAPGYKYHHVGQRNWYDEEKLGGYKLYQNTFERSFLSPSMKKCTYLDHSKNDKEARKTRHRIKQCQHSGSIFVTYKICHYHNPQWYVKATYAQLTNEQKAVLPQVDDSYPYLYYGLDGTK